MSFSSHNNSPSTTTPNKRGGRRNRKYAAPPPPPPPPPVAAAAASQPPSLPLGGKIPDELTLEILLRVSAKSLLRFKAISKPWQNLVDDPTFVHNHKRTRASVSPTRYLVKSYVGTYEHHDSFTLSLLRLTNVVDFDVIDLDVSFPDLPYDIPPLDFRVVGFSDGLFCVSCGPSFDVFIWNPATRESTPLPDGFDLGDDFLCAGCYFGFGFDSRAGYYKVLRVMTFFDIDMELVYRVVVCNAGGGRRGWREIDHPPLDMNYRTEDAVCVQGKCYFTSLNLFCYEQPLVEFDLTEEKFRLVPLPLARPMDHLESPRDWFKVLEVKGSVGLVTYVGRKNPYCFDIWMMNESSFPDCQVSWSRYMTVKTSLINYTVLFVTERDELLILDHDTEHLSLQDTRSGKMLDLQKKVPFDHRVFAYSESLVSAEGKS